jgi:hypothetical protein
VGREESVGGGGKAKPEKDGKGGKEGRRLTAILLIRRSQHPIHPVRKRTISTLHVRLLVVFLRNRR